MKIIILGAGQVGGTLAENLSSEANDITIVDNTFERLNELQDRLDVRTVFGNGSYPDILESAGAKDAEMLIAVTSSDEVNMVACQVAHTLFRTPTKIARVRAPNYFNRSGLFQTSAVPVDVIISPEQVVTNYICRLIEFPGALQVLDFAEGRVQLVAVKAYHGGPLVGQELRYLRQHMPNVETRVAAIFRRDRPILPEGSTVLEVDDEVFFIAARNHIRAVMSELRRLEHPYKRIIIAGGGNIGERLAVTLENKYQIKLIERNIERSKAVAECLSRSIVLQGDVTNQELLLQEGIEDTDVFLAVTNDDQANIMSSMLAKRLGARKVMTLINKPAFVDLVQGGDIDIAISPQQATIGSLLTHVRRADVVNLHSLRRGAAEAIEAIAHGDERTSKVIGKAIADVDLPEGATIGAIVRKEEVIIGHDDVVIEPEDHLIIFLVDKRRIRDVERLFEVGFGFF